MNPQTHALIAAHVRLIQEMSDEDDAGNCRSLGLLSAVSGRLASLATYHPDCPAPAHDDPWVTRAKAILDEECAKRDAPSP